MKSTSFLLLALQYPVSVICPLIKLAFLMDPRFGYYSLQNSKGESDYFWLHTQLWLHCKLYSMEVYQTSTPSVPLEEGTLIYTQIRKRVENMLIP